MGKRKGLEAAWQGPQYTFRSDEQEQKEEKREPSKEEKREPSKEEKKELSFEEMQESPKEEKREPSFEEMQEPSEEEKRKSSFEEIREQIDPLRKFNAMLPETLFFEWKTYCTKKRCKMQDLTAQALRRYMEANP